MRVRITPSAEADLVSIGEWISRDNPARAITFLDELRRVCGRLADDALAYPVVDRYARAGIRRRSYKRYIVLYRSDAEVVEILHVVHGARDYTKILAQDF